MSVSPAVRAELDRLVAHYGDDASAVGAADGTEDDWGDLTGELAMLLGIVGQHDIDQDAWDEFQDQAAALAEPATTIEQLYLRLLSKYGKRSPRSAELLGHVIADGCDDPDCELHHPEVAVEEGVAPEAALAWFAAGAFALAREFQAQYDIQDEPLVAITVALREVVAKHKLEA